MQATHLTDVVPSDMTRNTMRLAAYWFCSLCLLWSRESAALKLSLFPVIGLLVGSSLAICCLAYVATVTRNYLDRARIWSSPSNRSELPLNKILLTGLMAIEILIVLSVTTALQRLIF